ncbi:MAG TPA: ATP-binding protein, partial [Flavisolibacter sp.]|nr:ATP-binding protein [Flavisolibacter sp.]
TFDAHLLARSVRYCIEQKKAQEKIQDLNLQKQHLIKAVLDAQEHERKSIGEVLHDNINQVLTAVKLNLEMALAHPLGNEYLIDKSLQNVGFAIEEIRKLSRKFILSGNIKELGLVQSIHELIKEIQYIKNIRYTINAQNFADLGLSQEQKVNLYRIIQEQLNNIISHADASEATITISLENQNIILKISDNGKGFERSKKEKGIGFTKIINRAELLHGKAEIFSEPGMGCQILVKIPISSDNRPELEIAGLGPVHD